MSKEEVKNTLRELIEKYNKTLRHGNKSEISEETIRTWLNELLEIFNWNVQDITQVLQERKLRGHTVDRLKEINSCHNKPDYTLMNGTTIKTFLDAKSLDVDIFSDREAAYQIRCYGWSAEVPCAFVSNFEQFVIFDTKYRPKETDSALNGAIQITIDDYLNQFDTLYEHLWREKVCSNNLETIYNKEHFEGSKNVNDDFTSLLSTFRFSLAKKLIESNSEIILNDTILNYYTQVILDRIIFIRVCESKGIEEQEKLKHFKEEKNGFWNSFKTSCYMEFYNHYDGAMFERDDRFQKLKIDDEVFNKLIDSLYYPSPYKFEVIPVKTIASIYEEFLGKKLIKTCEGIKEVAKEEYIKTNGAIPTPEHIVDWICKQTIELEKINTISELLNLKILDPCCGSGVFLVTCYELISEKMIHIFESNKEERDRYNDYVYMENNRVVLTILARRQIATNCICGIDYDESAIEVTKMSLALKIVDGNDHGIWNEIGAYGNRILSEIANNIRLGNTLVDVDNTFSHEDILEIKPLDLKKSFQKVFDVNGGFDYIVTNPPYVETKHYKASYPAMHNYLSSKYSSFHGKADLAVLFIERCYNLLKTNGRLGMIIQRRWFRTDYGAPLRKIISKSKSLEILIDFKATDIFKKRIVYASIMVLSKKRNPSFLYSTIVDASENIRTKYESFDKTELAKYCNFGKINAPKDDMPWMFDNMNIVSIRNKLSDDMGTLKDFPDIKIKDGIQALWKKIYHLSNVKLDASIAIGKNGFGDDVKVESKMLRGLIYNKVFYPFKKVSPDAYCIFPYKGNNSDAITYDELKSEYPLTYEYLEKNKAKIKNEVHTRTGNRWHTFTREHNHPYYDEPKIIIPMTAKDTIATFSNSSGLYMDNSNVWFISIPNSSEKLMKAITCIINSTIFSVLGKVGANPQSGGYYKFNKQFLAPIPFPSKKLCESDKIIDQLASMYDCIETLQESYMQALPEQRRMLQSSIEDAWDRLDSICFDLYGMSVKEKNEIMDFGRTVSRVELLGE